MKRCRLKRYNFKIKNKMKKAALLASIYAASAMNAMNEIANPYDGLPEIRYNGNKQPERKTQLTKKQKKKRAAAKSARKARRKQRH
jgi:hypothetical protein